LELHLIFQASKAALSSILTFGATNKGSGISTSNAVVSISKVLGQGAFSLHPPILKIPSNILY
jgi:hypothetical protein